MTKSTTNCEGNDGLCAATAEYEAILRREDGQFLEGSFCGGCLADEEEAGAETCMVKTLGGED